MTESNENKKTRSKTHGCTIFTVSFGDKVFFGNNEDMINWGTSIWFEPGGLNEGERYGVAYVGFDPIHTEFDYFPQGAMNEKGLFYDWNALKPAKLKGDPKKEQIPDKTLMMKIMRECATVEEAIEMFQKYYWQYIITAQVQFGDANGDAVVISGGSDRKLVSTRKKKGDGYMISTNFNLADPENSGPGAYPCWRYKIADKMLKQIKNEEDLNVDFVRSVLDKTHPEGAVINTMYTNIFDAKSKMIYMYYFHQFEEVVKIDLAEELAKGTHIIKICDLFSQETVNKAINEYQSYRDVLQMKSLLKKSTDKPSAIIIEWGNEITKVGFGGEAEPRLILDTAIYYTNANEPFLKQTVELERKNIKNVTWFKKENDSFRWSSMEIFLDQVYNLLNVESDMLPTFFVTWLHSSPSDIALRDTEEIIELTYLLFTKFKVPAIYFGYGNTTSLFGGGRFTGLNIHLNDSSIQIAPIYRGMLNTNALQIINVNDTGIPEKVIQVIEKSNGMMDFRLELWENIVLSGNSSNFQEVKEILKKELPRLTPKEIQVDIIDQPERRIQSWIGGSCISLWNPFKRYWITRDEFEEGGLSCLERLMTRM